MIENHSHSWWSWDWQKVSYKNLTDIPAQIKHWTLTWTWGSTNTLTTWFQPKYIQFSWQLTTNPWWGDVYWDSHSQWGYHVSDNTNKCLWNRMINWVPWSIIPSNGIDSSNCFRLAEAITPSSVKYSTWAISATSSTWATLVITDDDSVWYFIHWIAYW